MCLFLQEMGRLVFRLVVHLLHEQRLDLMVCWSEWLPAVCELVCSGGPEQVVRRMVSTDRKERSAVEGLLEDRRAKWLARSAG